MHPSFTHPCSAKALDKLEKAESEYNGLMSKRQIVDNDRQGETGTWRMSKRQAVDNDRQRILQVIEDLDDKKKVAMKDTWHKVGGLCFGARRKMLLFKLGGQGCIWRCVEGVPDRAEWRPALPLGFVAAVGTVQVSHEGEDGVDDDGSYCRDALVGMQYDCRPHGGLPFWCSLSDVHLWLGFLCFGCARLGTGKNCRHSKLCSSTQKSLEAELTGGACKCATLHCGVPQGACKCATLQCGGPRGVHEPAQLIVVSLGVRTSRGGVPQGVRKCWRLRPQEICLLDQRSPEATEAIATRHTLQVDQLDVEGLAASVLTALDRHGQKRRGVGQPPQCIPHSPAYSQALACMPCPFF
eukprot:1160280-Pelagomonas_calceolata.AAC.4